MRIERQHLAQIQCLGHFERFGNGSRPDIPHRFRRCRNFRQCIARRRETKGIVHPAQLLERQVALQSIDSAGCTPAINQLRQFLQSLLHTCQIHSRIHFASKDRKKFRNTRPPAAAFFSETSDFRAEKRRRDVGYGSDCPCNKMNSSPKRPHPMGISLFLLNFV